MLRALLIWVGLIAVTGVPIAAAAASPLLAWRDPIYIIAGFAGVGALCLLLIQPLLVAGDLPAVPRSRGRVLHRWIGTALLIAVLLHVGGLWVTSPPDVIDALLFVSPTPFSVWGVIAMWALFAAALLGALRHRLRLRPNTWRRLHTTCVCVVVAGSIVHAVLIDGTMETYSKVALCALVGLAAIGAIFKLRVWSFRTASRRG